MLKRATVCNLYAYEGENFIEFSGKNFIHGINGHGKTSLINSLKLAFSDSDINLEEVINKNSENGTGYIKLETTEYTIYRSFDKSEKSAELKVTFPDSDTVILGAEAEEYLTQKMPSFMSDLVFYDGEIDRNIIMMSNSLQSKFFANIFDLDLLLHMKKDCENARKSLLNEASSDKDLSKVLTLENEVESLQTEIDALVLVKEKTRSSISSKKGSIENTRFKIYKNSAGLESLEKEKMKVQKEIDLLMPKIMPSLLIDLPFYSNAELFAPILKEKEAAVEVNSRLFPKAMASFIEKLGVENKDKITEFFISSFLTKSEHSLLVNKGEFASSVDEMNSLIYKIQGEINPRIKEILTNPLIKDVVGVLVEKLKTLENELHSLEMSLSESIDKLDELISKKNSIQADLAICFNHTQSAYSKIVGIESLDRIISETKNIIEKQSKERVEKFNHILEPIVANFTRLYPEMNIIQLNDDLTLKILDREGRKVSLLSAGQKQVLNFLIIKALIAYGGFSDFIVVDTPLGRLSKVNRKLIMEECYTSFDQMTLLITDTEADGIMELFPKAKSIKQAYPKSREYTISLGLLGSTITEGVVK